MGREGRQHRHQRVYGFAKDRKRLRALHGVAYDWQPPDVDAGERATSTSMRQYVRRWINEWDLVRLYPDYRPTIEVGQLTVDYDENPDLERDDADTR